MAKVLNGVVAIKHMKTVFRRSNSTQGNTKVRIKRV